MNGLVEVHRHQRRLEAKFKRVATLNFDAELQADFAKYLCVLTSGFLEVAVYEILVNHAKTKSSPEFARFVEGQLDRWTNPSVKKISVLLGSFSAKWRVEIEGYLVDEKKEAVGSLVALRHKIAHGESVGTSFTSRAIFSRSLRTR